MKFVCFNFFPKTTSCGNSKRLLTQRTNGNITKRYFSSNLFTNQTRNVLYFEAIEDGMKNGSNECKRVAQSLKNSGKTFRSIDIEKYLQENLLKNALQEGAKFGSKKCEQIIHKKDMYC
ncbi:hypothetical protein ABK040_014354 [Willaertia magna]